MSNILRAAVLGMCVTGFCLGYLTVQWYEDYDQPRSEHVFVYGTLTSPWIRLYACRCLPPSTPSTISGYSVQDRNLIPTPGAETYGYLLFVTPTELGRLDRYENTPSHYVRTRITVGTTTAWVYQKAE